MGCGFESLPSELLSRICAFFALKPHELGYPVLSEFRDNKTVLRQLCLTSRSLYHAAIPFLYCAIIISGPGQRLIDPENLDSQPLILLLRTLLENPQLRCSIKHIACLVNLKRSRVSSRELDGLRQLWNDHCQGIKLGVPSDARVLQLADLPTSAEASDETGQPSNAKAAQIPAGSNLEALPERIFAAVLCFAPNLDSVVFQMPHCSRAPAPSNLDSIRCAMTSRIIDSALQDALVGPTVLQKLTTVKVQADMTAFLYNGWDPFDEDESVERGVRLDACPGLFNAPNITTVEGYKESGGWDALPRGTKDVRLFGLLEPTTLGKICDYPNLERLTVQPAPMEMPKANPKNDVFNTALTKRASTLKYLEFLTMGNETLTASYGPKKRLHCLPQLTKLEDLSLEIFALFGTSDKIGTQKLQDLLPPGLQSLFIMERWTFGDQLTPPVATFILKSYRAKLIEMLISFAKSCPSQLPELRRFTWSRHSDLLEISGQVNSPDFKRLESLFSKAGIKLILEVF